MRMIYAMAAALAFTAGAAWAQPAGDEMTPPVIETIQTRGEVRTIEEVDEIRLVAIRNSAGELDVFEVTPETDVQTSEGEDFDVATLEVGDEVVIWYEDTMVVDENAVVEPTQRVLRMVVNP